MFAMRTDDGLPLHLRCWSASAPARGTVLLVHGLGEHVGRYDTLAHDLNRQGWHVMGYDQRGHGASGGARGHVAAPHSLLADLGLLVDHVRTQLPGPLVLLGHSLGGVVAARYAAEALAPQPAAWFRPVDGLVLSSPALDAGLNGLMRGLLRVMVSLRPDQPLHNGLRAEWLSRDPAAVAAYRADPLVHDRITPRLVRFIVDAGVLVRLQAPRWQLPTLLLYAGSDRCVDPEGSADFAARAPQRWVSSRCFEHCLHEIFNEPGADGRAVLQALQGGLQALQGQLQPAAAETAAGALRPA